MQPLVRPEFRPKLWSAADLDAAARHWLWLFGQAPATAGRAADHRTELRLRGVPGAARKAVAAALTAQFPDAEVTRPDPDTLVAISPEGDSQKTPPAGLGVPSLAGPPFEGLYLEVRFTATARKRSGKPFAAGTLVFAGELGPDGFTVYAVWAEAGPVAANQPPDSVPWADEASWRLGLETYRAGNTNAATAKALAQRAFPMSKSVRSDDLWRWVASFPFTGERRRLRLLTRVAVNLTVVAVVAGYAWIVPTPDAMIVAWKLTLLLASASPLYCLLLQVAKSWAATRRYMRSTYTLFYSDPEPLVPADGRLASTYFDNPFGRKVVADWEAAGCRRLGDAVPGNVLMRQVGCRLLCSAESTTTVVLIAARYLPNPDGKVRLYFWPAQVVVMLTTRFADGSTAVTMSGPGSLYRRNLYGTEFLGRVDPGRSDPADLLTMHADLCRDHAARTGQSPMPAGTFGEFVRWDLEHVEEERRLYAHNSVTWSDAFVLLMGYVRRAYR